MVCPLGQAELFTDVGTSEIQSSVFEREGGRTVLRRRVVHVDLETLRRRIQIPGNRVRLNLYDDRSVEVRITSVQMPEEGNVISTGNVAGDEHSDVTIVSKDEVMIANIHDHTRNETYEVRYRPDGTHTIETVAFENSDDCETVVAPDDEVATMGAGADEPLAAIPVVDMLVAYTPNAMDKVGGRSAMLALIQTGIADTNRAFLYSGVNLRARLVGTYRVLQNEAGSWSSDLAALRGKSDGRWDAIHAERARLGADQVTLIGAYTNAGSTNGIAYINAGATSAFAIVKTASFGAFTFTHELGHSIGLNHSDGYENRSGGFRTVMAYGTKPRIRRFSNPDRPYNGWRTGTSTRDSVDILNANAGRISRLYRTVVADQGESEIIVPESPEGNEPTPPPAEICVD